MDRNSPSRRAFRTVLGIAAIYGLLLQVFLAAATPVAALDLAGHICAASDDAGQPAGDTALPRGHQCCTLAHAGGVAPLPDLAFVTVPYRVSVLLRALRPEAAIPRTGPPRYAQSARGPPVV